ncbi:MAG: phenylacetate--CoA ligase [Desulfurococcales archaeon]|nr:phenylacetate--CoA ligase [Desulfurococcales archaeon]
MKTLAKSLRKTARFFDPIETASRETITKIKLKRLKWTVKHAYENNPLYRRTMKQHGITPSDIKTLSDITKLPFTRKQHLRENYPYGMTSVPLEEIVELHASSGTTGKPTVVAYTRGDLENWGSLMARTMSMQGVTSRDIVYVALGYHWFTGGLGFHYGGLRLGATVVPAGTGYTRRNITMIRDLGATVLAAVPNYMIRLAEVAGEMGVDLKRDTEVHTALLGAEMWTEELRNRIERIWGIDAYDVYGMSELYGPGAAGECHVHDGLHVWEDHYLVEIVDPKTGEPLEPEEKGVLVVTPLTHEAMPLLRYWTNDITFLYDSTSCDCRRSMQRIGRITGRADDMLVINGVNVFPSSIETVLLRIGGVSPNYRVIVYRESGLDKLRLEVEADESVPREKYKALERLVQNRLKEVLLMNPRVELLEPGSIDRVDGGKGKRIIDLRK